MALIEMVVEGSGQPLVDPVAPSAFRSSGIRLWWNALAQRLPTVQAVVHTLASVALHILNSNGLAILMVYPVFSVIALSSACAYTVYKRRSARTASSTLGPETSPVLERVGESASRGLLNNPYKIFQSLFTLFWLSNGITLWSLTAIYGIWSLDKDAYLSRLKIVGAQARDLSRGFFSPFHRLSSQKQLIVLGVGTALILTQIYFSGPTFILALALGTVQLAAFAVGLSHFLAEIKKQILDRPIHFALENSLRLLGTIWGYWLAYNIFGGTIAGNFGPAFGTVANNGLFAGSLASMFAPTGGFVISHLGLFARFFESVGNSINNLMTNLLLVGYVRGEGHFDGTVGPGSEQIVMMMVLGYFVGKKLERWLDALVNILRSDLGVAAAHTSTGTQRAYQKLYNRNQWCTFSSLLIFMAFSPVGETLLMLGPYPAAIVGLMSAFIANRYLHIAAKHLGPRFQAYRQARARGPVAEGAVPSPVRTLVPTPVPTLVPTSQISIEASPAPAVTPAFTQLRERPVVANDSNTAQNNNDLAVARNGI